MPQQPPTHRLVEGRQRGVDAKSVTTEDISLGTDPVIESIAYHKLQAKSANSDTEIVFDGVDSLYGPYVIVIDGLVPETDGDDIELQMSTDGGSAWENGSTDYKWAERGVSSNSATFATYNNGDSKIVLRGNLGSAAGESFSRRMTVSNAPNSDLYTFIYGVSTHIDAGGNFTHTQGGGVLAQQSPVNAIRIRCSSGNIADGTFKLLGGVK